MTKNQLELPHPWERMEGCPPDGVSELLDRALGYSKTSLGPSDWRKVSGDEWKEPVTERARLATQGRWEMLLNAESGGRALVRVQLGASGGVDGFSAVVFLPPEGESFVPNLDPKSLPLKSAAIAYASDLDTSRGHMNAILAAGRSVGKDEPLGDADGSEAFYARVALQFLQSGDSEKSPAAHLAEVNGVHLTTAQRWVTKARKLGFLPPGRPGRRKKASGDGLD